MAGRNSLNIMELVQFQQLIRANCGLEFPEDKQPLLISALNERMANTAILEPSAYLTRLKASPAELAELIDLVTINESYFFREPEQIRLLVETLIPGLLAANSGKLRILSLGCAHGEEPYTLAMALEEALGQETAMQCTIQGTDIDRKALESARHGIYRDFAFRGLKTELASKYFITLEPGRYQIMPRLRTRVTFMHLNLLESGWPETLMEQDVIFFRNVSIYFDAEVRQQIQRQITKVLRPGGLLFMSATETLSNDFGLMELDQQADIFFFRNQPPAPQSPRETPPKAAKVLQTRANGVQKARPESASSTGHSPRPETPRTELDPDKIFAQALAQAEAGLIDEALAMLTHLTALAGDKSHQLRLLAILLYLKEDYARAAQILARLLKEDDLDPKALFLLGQIHRRQGNPEDAIAAFKKVIFSQPDHWQAHYLLAECHRQKEGKELAGRSYRRVVQILEQPPAPSTDPAMRLIEMPAGKIALLAKHRLAELHQA